MLLISDQRRGNPLKISSASIIRDAMKELLFKEPRQLPRPYLTTTSGIGVDGLGQTWRIEHPKTTQTQSQAKEKALLDAWKKTELATIEYKARMGFN